MAIGTGKTHFENSSQLRLDCEQDPFSSDRSIFVDETFGAQSYICDVVLVDLAAGSDQISHRKQ